VAAVLALAIGVVGVCAAPASALRCPKVVGSSVAAERAVVEVRSAVEQQVPKLYAGMTNQSGRGAWRGYVVLALLTLGPDRVKVVAKSYRVRAVRACGEAVADRSWVALITFPNAGSVNFGGSVAYLAPTKGGWTIWRTEVVPGS
jgi:hypothetical protein